MESGAELRKGTQGEYGSRTSDNTKPCEMSSHVCNSARISLSVVTNTGRMYEMRNKGDTEERCPTSMTLANTKSEPNEAT